MISLLTLPLTLPEQRLDLPCYGLSDGLLPGTLRSSARCRVACTLAPSAKLWHLSNEADAAADDAPAWRGQDLATASSTSQLCL